MTKERVLRNICKRHSANSSGSNQSSLQSIPKCSWDMMSTEYINRPRRNSLFHSHLEDILPWKSIRQQHREASFYYLLNVIMLLKQRPINDGFQFSTLAEDAIRIVGHYFPLPESRLSRIFGSPCRKFCIADTP